MVLSLNFKRSVSDLRSVNEHSKYPSLCTACQSLLKQGGEEFILTLNERDKVLPTVFFGRLLSFHFFALFTGFYKGAFFGRFVLNLKT